MSEPALGAPPAAAAPTTGTDSRPLDPRRWIALVVIGISQLMVVLDATITNVAMPTAAADLGLQQSDIQWVVTSYALPFGALLLLGGRIADYVGRKKVLILALSGFALASVIGGIAGEAWMLYAGRALQGAFAAMLAPAALSLLTVTFTAPKERAKAFAVFGAIAGGGAAIGLLLGGFLTEYLSTDAIAGWRWCFLVNIPIAVVAAILGARILTESKATERGHYDLPGALLATAGLAALVWGFTRPIQPKPGATDGSLLGWGSAQTLGWLAAAVLLLAGFVLVERRSSNPLLPMRIVTNRNRAGAYLVGMLVGAGMFSVFLFLTLYLQDYKLFSPMETGFAFLPFSAGIVVGAGVGSQLVLRIGARFVIALGATLGTVGLFLFSTIDVDTSYFGHLFPAMLVMAFGMGFIFMSTTNLALVGIGNNDAGVASAVFNTTQQIGGSLGTALLSTVAYSSAASYITARLTPGVSAEQIAQLRDNGTVTGYGTAFTWAACLFIGAVVIALVVVNARKDDVPAPTGTAHLG